MLLAAAETAAAVLRDALDATGGSCLDRATLGRLRAVLDGAVVAEGVGAYEQLLAATYPGPGR